MELSKAIDFFFNHCIYEKNLSKKTMKAYKSDFKQFFIFIKDNKLIHVENIDKRIIKEYISLLFKRLKPKSIKRKIATLKCFFNYLEFEDTINKNPFRKIRIKLKLPYQLPVFLNLQELKQIFKVLYDLKKHSSNKNSFAYKALLRDIAIIECLFALGIRVSELCSLQKENINIETGEVLITGKGNKERMLYLNNTVREQFKVYRNYFSNELKMSNYFFINRLNHKISEQSVRTIVKKYAQMAKIKKHVTPHVFRHSFASLLLKEGVNLRYIQECLGHASITTTQLYSHIDCSKQKQILTFKHPRRLIQLS